MDLFHLHREKV